MYRRCTTEKTAKQQQAFISCLFDSMGKQRYEEITVSNLCQQAGLSRNVFYHLFDSKDDALSALLDRALLDAADFILPDHLRNPNYPDQLLHFLYYWKSQKPLLDALEANSISMKLVERAISHTYNEEPGILQQLDICKDKDAVEKTTFWVSGMMSIILTWHHAKFQKTVEEIADIILNLQAV